mmetsp:Transcript_22810/g.22035  ORF Transcript_22810/g.22035 Transcript_22810/m.22035 type:complete len:119 (-) Transcript_22810:57-413(-)
MDTSRFFINEIVDSLKNNRSGYGDWDIHYKILTAILKQSEEQEMQEMRIRIAFNFECEGEQPSLILYLESLRNTHKKFVLKTLTFIGEACVEDPKVLEMVRKFQQQLTWVFTTLRGYS